MKRLQEFIDQILRRVKRREGKRADCEGGRRYSDWLLIKLWTICAVKRWSFSTWYEKLRWDGAAMREEWGLPRRMPSRSQAYERLREPSFGARLREFFDECTREALRSSPAEGTQVIAIDLTALEAHRGDGGAALGHTSEKRRIWGYKLGLVVSADGIPMAFRLMKANWVEGNVSRPLIREAKARLKDVGRLRDFRHVAADKGFDSEKNFREVARGTGATLVCPGRRKRRRRVKRISSRRWFERNHYPYRTPAVRFSRTAEGKAIYRKRNVVEQVNGQLKDDPFGIDRMPPHVRGLRRMRSWCLGRLLYFILALNVNHREGRYNRSLRVFAA